METTTTDISKISRKLGINVSSESAILREMQASIEQERSRISNLIEDASAAIAAQADTVSQLPAIFSEQISNINNQIDYLVDSAPAFTESAPSSSISEGQPGKMASDNESFYICGQDNVWRRIPLQNF